MDQNWKLLYDFNTFEQAQFTKQTLEENGLRCLLLDEHSSKFVNYFRTHGGVRLLVHENDIEKAIPIVKNLIDFQATQSTLEKLEKSLKGKLFGDLNVVYKLLIITLVILAIVIGGLFFTLK